MLLLRCLVFFFLFFMLFFVCACIVDDPEFAVVPSYGFVGEVLFFFRFGSGDHVGVVVVDVMLVILEIFIDIDGDYEFDGCCYDLDVV